LDIGHPDVAIRLFAYPSTVVIEFAFVLGEGGRQVGGRHRSVEKPVPRLVPTVKAVHRGIERLRIGLELSVRGDESLIRLDDHGTAFAGGLGRTFVDEDLGRIALADVEAVESLFEDIEGGVGCVDLDALLPFEGRHTEVGLTGPDVDLDMAVAPPGKGRELGLTRHAKPEEVPPPELDLSLAVPGHELITLRDGEVHLTGLRPELRSPIDRDCALDVAQPGVALVISLARLGKGRDRSQRH
jgi:hypothetical protein